MLGRTRRIRSAARAARPSGGPGRERTYDGACNCVAPNPPRGSPTSVKFLLDNWLLILIALTSGGLLLWPKLAGGGLAPAGGADAVGTGEAVRLMNREKAVLIDVREPAEYAAGHPVGARSLPLGQLQAGAKGLPTNKQLPVIVSCATGQRARKGAAALKGLGYEQVRVLSGGLAAWREANLPVERA